MDTTDEKKSAWAWLRGDDSEETEDDEVELCGGQVVSVADFDMMVAAMVEKVVSQACLCACGFCGLSSSLSSGFVVISIRVVGMNMVSSIAVVDKINFKCV